MKLAYVIKYSTNVNTIKKWARKSDDNTNADAESKYSRDDMRFQEIGQEKRLWLK